MTKITTFAVIAFFQLLSLLPIRLLRCIGGLMGSMLWLTGSRSRAVTEENLSICFPAMDLDERTALAKSSLQHLAMTALELGPVWRRSTDSILATVEQVEGLDILEQALADDRGLIVLAPHLGSWELMGLYLAELTPVSSMYQPPDSPAMQQLMFEARGRNGADLVPTDTTGVKALLQRLKKGGVIGVLPDQVPPKEGGDFAPFFGVSALTTTLIQKLVQRTGAKVIMACALRINHTGKFRVVLIEVPEEVGADDDLQALAVLNKSVEQFVLLAPEQYQWEYKRFKRQPEGNQKYYHNK